MALARFCFSRAERCYATELEDSVRTRFKVALGGAALSVGVLAAAFGPIVRHEAAAVAERYGASIEVARILPTWHGARLRGVDVRLRGVPSASVHFDEIEVGLGLSGRRVALRGGRVDVVGPRDTVAGELEAWREARGGRAGSGTAGASASGPHLDRVSFRWRNAAENPSERVEASSLSVRREAGGTIVDAEAAEVAAFGTTLRAKDAHLELSRRDGAYRVRAVSAAALDAEVDWPVPADDAAAPSAPTDRQALPKKGADAAPEPASRSDEGERAKRLRARLVQLAALLDGVLDPGAVVSVHGVTARVRRGDDVLNLGPGTLDVQRPGERLVVELAPGVPKGGDETEQVLTFRLSVPLRAGAASADLVADVEGGPIWLSTLGVREGDFGLMDVAQTSIETRSHLVLSADGAKITASGEGKIHALSLRNAALSDEPVQRLELAFRGKGEAALDGSHVRVDEGEVDLGAIRLDASGTYDRAGASRRVRGTFEVPLTACQAMLDSTPKGLIPKLSGMRMAGSFAIKGKVAFDTAAIDRDFDLRWDVSNTCRVADAPVSIHIDQFRRPFHHAVVGPDGQSVDLVLGPQTPGWVPYSGISKFMEVALLTTEDGGFYRHHGFDEEAIRNSIRDNLKKGRFVRGASTLSMQLAKNLYLGRKKTLSRKLQEAVLTMYLEQELTKEQILELYLNVVEFGPMVYGIGPAARHYFSTSPATLSLGQALYISSILPNPKVQHFVAGGAVSPGYTNYLRKLMQLAHKRRRITDAELEDGLAETVLRGSPAPARSKPTSDATVPATSDEAIEPPDDGADWVAP
jgi:hypothetical protein